MPEIALVNADRERLAAPDPLGDISCLELNADFGPTTGYFDDLSFAVGRPPNLTVTLSGTMAVLTWPGLNFALQSASAATGPYSDVNGAASPYPYDTTSGPHRFFRLRQM